MARRFDTTTEEGLAQFRSFLKESRGGDTDAQVVTAAAEIVADVRLRGGQAVRDLTQRFDSLEIDAQSLTSSDLDMDRLADQCPKDIRDAIEFAAKRIEAYHEKQRPEDHSFVDAHDIGLGWRWTSIDAVGLYVPGGRASYPSSVLMNAIPAKAAGVKRMVMVAPAPNGVLNPAVAYAARVAGVSEFYPIGGAQAVAALAYGAGDLLPVDKIVGPGNAFVAAAKRIVFGDVGIDTIAGPSEICVVADDSVAPRVIAADLLSQAEHDPAAQSILVTSDAGLCDLVEAAVEIELSELATQEVARVSWSRHGAIVHAKSEDIASIVDLIAPEHVELAISDPTELLNSIRHAGAIFVGAWAPEALGDYVTGSNHVLPTSGAARFSSGLSVLDFMKRTSIQVISPRGFAHLADAAETLAKAEGLPAHARSVSSRRNANGGSGDE